jgi:uncharacterized BrkB/YihY/UPF0761 family membrane protein
VSPSDIVQLPPVPKISDYPVATSLIGVALGTALLLWVAGRFDPTAGVLTLSLLVVFTFMGVVIFCIFFTIPTDEATAAVIGGLVAGFGAVIAHWLGRSKEGPK